MTSEFSGYDSVYGPSLGPLMQEEAQLQALLKKDKAIAALGSQIQAMGSEVEKSKGSNKALMVGCLLLLVLVIYLVMSKQAESQTLPKFVHNPEEDDEESEYEDDGEAEGYGTESEQACGFEGCEDGSGCGHPHES